MRIALAQQQPAADTAVNLRAAERTLEDAAGVGVELVCFNQFFLGSIDRFDASCVSALVDAAGLHRLEILTGAFFISENDRATDAFVSSDGRLAGFNTGSGVVSYITALGPTAIVPESSAYDDAIDAEATRQGVQAVVMQVSAVSLLEQEAIKELALSRSLSTASVVACVSPVGPFLGQQYLGCTLIARNGELIAEAGANQPELLVAEIDPTQFVNYWELREHVVIPELLRQKRHLL